ncbi:hypothetical protein HUA76_33620 [Myxococcus sp. CA056]|uniref:hypothetical protein n=1 Tax=Myxococcus sp. CA056 TaxID=2741740 RepID=UPI00157B0393|nr:hypothetical protein [Myxococcus sp. CA056]NTX15718.1 hypothetical protein [Myxococcus sp. CA056]
MVDSSAVPSAPPVKPVRRVASRREQGVVFSVSFLFLLVLEALFRRFTTDGLRFQAWNSERMMQTLSLRELRDEPVRSLWYLHIQPPLLDMLRAVLGGLHGSLDSAALVDAVDRWTYVAWALVFAATVTLVFAWVHRVAGRAAAIVGAVVTALHPGALAFATLLDSTAASALAFLWFCFELSRLQREGGSIARLATASLVLFFLRSIFQWPFFLLVALCLALRNVPLRRVGRYVALVALFAGPYVAKQLALFGTSMTSTFDGLNFCRAIGLGEPDLGAMRLPSNVLPTGLPSPSSAAVLRQDEKLGGYYNYNHLDALRYSVGLKYVCRRALLEQPLSTTLASFAENASLYGEPSSRYQPNVLVDRLPWREPLDFFFSSPVLWLLLLLTGGMAARRLEGRAAWLRVAGLLLPVLYVATVSILFEKGENMRFKYFIEPVLLVFLCVEGSRLAARVVARFTTHTVPVKTHEGSGVG